MKFIWNVVFILQLGAWVSSEQVVLDDKPGRDQSGNWKWEWQEFKPVSSGDGGWKTLTTIQNPRIRFFVCSIGLIGLSSQPNNWLRSDRISVSEANRVDVTVEYSIQSCGSASFCTQFIDLYVNQSDTLLDSANYPDPLTNVETYKKFGFVNDNTGATLKETIPLTINKKYILLAFHEQGGCKTLFSVKVTYYFCPEQTLMKNLVSLPRTVAPANDSDNFQVNGSCMANTVPLPGSLLVRCQSDGEWNASGLEGKCVCKEGMENIGGSCKDCPDGKFNMNKGMNCSLCPDNSESTNDKKSCSCKDLYYRAPGESITENCTAIPSAPKQATTSFVNQSTVVLQWSPPDDNGGRNDVYYDVECRKPCEDDDDKDCVDIPCRDDVMYIPASKRLNATKVTVQNLLSFVNYTFTIYAKNGVSEMAVGKNFTSFNVKTNGSVPGIPEVSVDWLAENSLARVSWTLQRKNGVIKEYHVTHTREDDSPDGLSSTTKEESIDVEDLEAEKTYKFEVFAVNQFGQGPPGVKTFKVPTGGLSEKWIIVFAAVGGALLLVMIIMIIVFCYRRKHPKNLESFYMRTLEQGLDMQSPDQRQYIDPNDYLDIKQLLTAFTAELDRNVIKLEGLIGSGEFADVYKGIIKTQEGRMFVAVKILRPGSSEKNQKDFLSEASIMGQFKHHNVIELVGVVTESQPMMIATELLESGSLEHFLKEREGQLTNLQLLGMARGVASGMVYLSEMNFIHRDIAARNILVGENMSCKVTDFGLSRELADDNPDSEYETQGGKVPVRWTAPEALQHRKFSSASDVWSYGILLWEIMSFCDRPYWQWNNYDVISRVETGYRLPSPKGCPSIIHQLMLECWDADRNKRPKFADIVSRLDELIRSPEFLKDDLAHLVSASTEVDFTDVQTVDDWLKKINMDKYSEIFHAANMENLDQVMQLQEKDLKEMGISLIGHRNKMTKSIKALKAKYINEGFDEGEGAI